MGQFVLFSGPLLMVLSHVDSAESMYISFPDICTRQVNSNVHIFPETGSFGS